MQAVLTMQSNLNQIKVEVQESTTLLPELINIVTSCADFTVAMLPLERDETGQPLTGESNTAILDGIKVALSDPECPRQIINAVFSNFILHRRELNQIMRDLLERGDSINLDGTNLGYPDFSNLDASNRFSAVGSAMYRPRFTNANLTGANLENLDVFEPSVVGMIVTLANTDGSNLINNYLADC